ncbi:UPF0348 protein [Tepiditoga spiralis]|uniref:tRNA(Met) cytidine acetate ligase n=1 Tax=Tepiditoga spiralis TaxID=2108365 RepID=A0A7G1G4D5_9BACT|nr:nucleotidyltransferase [Tepiditoga spiralis]BBE31360.1 UPF0348 protein [Tepiditoga spiralis]
MNVLGLIVEYNPFHNGHLYHLNSAKKIVSPDYTVAVMSGNFVQRGEPAIINKFSRTETALNMGIDIVFELPFVYATQSAGTFANGSIGVLERTNVVTDIVFGSESSNIEYLKKISNVLITQKKEYTNLLKYYLKKGLSFPNARKEALKKFFDNDTDIEKIVEKSNDILGIEYLNNLNYYNSKIIPHTIQRHGSDYNDSEFKGKLSSATAIRKLIFENKISKIENSVPKKTLEILKREISKGNGPINLEKMREIILYKLRLSEREDITDILDIKEGLDKRFIEYSKRSKDINDLLKKVKSKRFTYTRVKRSMLNILFDLKDYEYKKYAEYGPQYLRVLGFNKKGQKLLNIIKKKSKYPIITTPSQYYQIYKKLIKDLKNEDKKYDSIPEIFLEQIKYDFKASNIYSLLYQNKISSSYEEDMIKKVIML